MTSMSKIVKLWLYVMMRVNRHHIMGSYYGMISVFSRKFNVSHVASTSIFPSIEPLTRTAGFATFQAGLKEQQYERQETRCIGNFLVLQLLFLDARSRKYCMCMIKIERKKLKFRILLRCCQHRCGWRCCKQRLANQMTQLALGRET